MEPHPKAASSRGFTLIELMIVVAIATILLAIAVPLYMDQTRQSRRTEAKQALLDLAGREERYFSTMASYTNVAANLGYTAFPTTVGSGYYTVTVCSPASAACGSNALAAPSYSFIATPLGTQTKDTQCTSFSVDSTGLQYATGSQTAAFCWAN
ncbi:MAG TPA: type IV pilin protein [Steroidobacteraceae bacterium]|jgi:type IV pilus assembly protein PilE